MMKKLLLADDSITIQKVVGIIFATEDFDLTMTDDGDSAFEKALELVPDLVIADISMPGKDGFELCRAIKSEPSLSQTSVLLLPGAFDHFDENKAQEVCADGWLTKPFESQSLIEKVHQLIEADPVRMAGVSAAVVEEISVPDDDVFAPFEDPAVNETVLGLDAVDELEPVAESLESSPDDIWDAVSFEEDDLQAEEDPIEVETDSPFVAAGFGGTVVDEEPEILSAVVSEESVLGDDDFLIEDIAEEDIEEEDSVDFVNSPEIDSALTSSEIPIIEESSVKEEASDDVDFSSFEDENAFSVESGEEDIFSAQADQVDVLDVTEELSDEVESVKPALVSLDVEDESPLELVEEEVVTVFADEEPASVEDERLEPQASEGNEDIEDDDILDLSEDDVIEELSEEDIVEDPVLVEEPLDLAEGGFELTETDVDESEPGSFTSADEVLEVTAPAGEIDDDTFYFDEPEEDGPVSENVAAAGIAAGAAAIGSFVTDEPAVEDELAVPAVSAVEQVETQLRELSDDELKEVVSRVAGPIIEKIAGEMLEKIAWEVVPDLAEAMIKEEIRKIKQAVAS